MILKRLFGTGLVAISVAFTMGPVFADGTQTVPDRSASPGAVARTEATPAAVSPTSDDDLIAKVRVAISNHDLDFFDKHLVDWDGARKRTQRLTLFQIRQCFGRPIKSVGLEPLKPDPAVPLVPEGYRTNLPVTHLLRIAFDEQHAPDEAPACVFMLSKDPKASYRMVLVLPTAPPAK